MSAADFHKKPFDEGTLTKLQVFELYAREWLPVFLSPEKPPRPEIHVFDFFAGPGTDSTGEFGSPLRLLRQLKEYQDMAGWPHVSVHAHFPDASASKIRQLEANIDSHQLRLPRVNVDVQPLKFEEAIPRCAANWLVRRPQSFFSSISLVWITSRLMCSANWWYVERQFAQKREREKGKRPTAADEICGELPPVGS